MGRRPLDGYPQSVGYSKMSVFPHAGPASYIPMQPGSPTAVPIDDGDRVYAVEAGLKYFDYVAGGISDDGLYEVVAVPLNESDNGGANTPAGGTTSYGLVWYTINTRTQVTEGTDLSGSIVRLFATGPK